MHAPKIISIGEVLWDLFPDGERFGGAPANFACHTAIGGGDVVMLSAVGDDIHGKRAVKVLEDYGVGTRLVQVAPGAETGTVGIELDRSGKPTFAINEKVAWDSICFSEETANQIQLADAVYFGTLAQRSDVSRQTIQRCIQVARDHGIPRVLDINLRAPFFDHQVIRSSIELASILKLSDDELAATTKALEISSGDTEQILRKVMQQFSLDLIVLTRGAQGAILVTPKGTVDQPGIPTNVRDTVGAGDAFISTFVLGMLAGDDHEDLLKKSCQAASAVCGISGAVPSLRD